jgi:hypothetical protein
MVVRNTMTMLNAGMEEGLKNVMFYGTRKEFKEPVRFGVIAAITRDAYMAREALERYRFRGPMHPRLILVFRENKAQDP